MGSFSIRANCQAGGSPSARSWSYLQSSLFPSESFNRSISVVGAATTAARGRCHGGTASHTSDCNCATSGRGQRAEDGRGRRHLWLLGCPGGFQEGGREGKGLRPSQSRAALPCTGRQRTRLVLWSGPWSALLLAGASSGPSCS